MPNRRLICKDFIGNWKISRYISDALACSKSFYFGEAVILQEGSNYRYNECGKLKIANGVPLFAKQSYLWKPVELDVFDICFKNGRSFHRLDLKGACGESTFCAEHLCIADLYKISYNFSEFPFWYSVCSVKGPKKFYKISSFFRRSYL